MKQTVTSFIVLMFAFFISDELAVGAEPGAGPVIFSREIQPLLAKHCLECHGTDKSESGLRLDSHQNVIVRLESGEQAVVPGKPQDSELFRRVTSEDELTRMPPEGEPLSKTEIDLLRRWIDQGAEYEEHWSYRPITEPELPEVKNQQWVRSPI
ncbi:MAG: hypothetical protein JJ992_22340, partial [Planctomycetes bacterium]|nr:hypothetical protein [Planctomycetota bacterium]